jgi:hypothetical protein
MTGKKKQVDFSVRPRAAKEELPATPDQWVREGQDVREGQVKEGKDAITEKQKRLTLNLPAKLHTAFKARCVMEGDTIQDKVQWLIERELAADRQVAEDKPTSA